MGNAREYRTPQKMARGEFPRYGGVRVQAPRHEGHVYRFGDGSYLAVRESATFHQIIQTLESLRGKFGQPERSALDRNTRKASGHPQIDMERLTATEHAKDRLALMKAQAAVSFTDVLHAVRLPEQVLWSDRHESWMWVGSKVCLAVKFADDGHAYITTILWSSDELWEAHPRPATTSKGRS